MVKKKVLPGLFSFIFTQVLIDQTFAEDSWNEGLHVTIYTHHFYTASTRHQAMQWENFTLLSID